MYQDSLCKRDQNTAAGKAEIRGQKANNFALQTPNIENTAAANDPLFINQSDDNILDEFFDLLNDVKTVKIINASFTKTRKSLDAVSSIFCHKGLNKPENIQDTEMR